MSAPVVWREDGQTECSHGEVSTVIKVYAKCYELLNDVASKTFKNLIMGSLNSPIHTIPNILEQLMLTGELGEGNCTKM